MKKTFLAIWGLTLLFVTSYSTLALEVPAGVIRSAVKGNNGNFVKDGIRYKVDELIDCLPEGTIPDDYLVNLYSCSTGNKLSTVISFGPIFAYECPNCGFRWETPCGLPDEECHQCQIRVPGKQISGGMYGVFSCDIILLGPVEAQSGMVSESASTSTHPVQVAQEEDISPIVVSTPTVTENPKSESCTDVGTSGKVVNVPDSIELSGDIFYVVHDQSRNLYVGMELVTPHNVGWWKERLAYDAYFHFKAVETYRLRDQAIIMPPSMPQESITMTGDFCFSSDPVPQMEKDALRWYSPYMWEIGTNQAFISLYQKLGTCECSSLCCEHSPSYELSKGLAGAMRGFAYNLENYTKGGNGATWVAYVSSRPIHGPLYLDHDFCVASSDIKMAMTVKISDPFYSPLGIYRSPIANACDKAAGIVFKNLSMTFHSNVARIVLEKIRPGNKYVVVRPLNTMRKIFESSGLKHYSVSTFGNRQDVPHISYEGGEPGWYHTPVRNFALVEPATNTAYKISENHWFFISPFLGGQDEKQFFEEFPFYLIDCAELAHLK